MSLLTHFPLKPGCNDYSFLDQEVEDFEHGHDSILIDYVNTPELDASFDEDHSMASSVPSGFLHFISTISDHLDYSLFLASNVINYDAMLEHYFCLYSRQEKCQLLKQFIIFSVIQKHLYFGMFSPTNITLNPANEKIDLESFLFSDWHWCSCSCQLRHIAAYFSYQSYFLIQLPL